MQLRKERAVIALAFYLIRGKLHLLHMSVNEYTIRICFEKTLIFENLDFVA